MELSQDQQNALDGILSEVRNGASELALIGYAGTGKTTLTARLVEECQANRIYPIVTAPTHKAAYQLSMRLSYPVQTIHSALGLTEHVDVRTGKVSFRPSRKSYDENAVQDAKLLIVDEASMIGTDLLKYVREAAPRCVLWVGDDAQLPPVGETSSPALACVESPYKLEHVHRYAGDILQEATRVRHARESGRNIPLPRAGDGVVLYQPGSGFLEEAARLTDARVVGWTNKCVDAASSRIHSLLHGQDAPPWIEGQSIVAVKPVFLDGDLYMHSSSEAEVLKVSRIVRHNVPCWQLWTRCYRTGEAVLHVVSARGQDTYLLELARRKQAALNVSESDPTSRKKAWKHYYEFEKSFAEVRATYSTTCHKAQGSTYTHAFVHLRDIMRNPNQDERLRCYYTAITRAAESLHILV